MSYIEIKFFTFKNFKLAVAKLLNDSLRIYCSYQYVTKINCLNS